MSLHLLFTDLPFLKLTWRVCADSILWEGSQAPGDGWIGNPNLATGVNGCLSLYAGTVMRRRFVQGGTYLLPEGSWIFIIYFSTDD